MAPRPTCQCGTCPKCERRLYMRDYYRRNRDRVCEIARASRERNIERAQAYDRMRGEARGTPLDEAKLSARDKVRVAIRNGSLVRKPCEVCGEPRTHAHHEDYSRPLDVRWLCPVHHGLEHRRVFAETAA